MKIVTVALSTIVGFILVFGVLMIYKSKQSQNPELGKVGLAQGKLRECGSKPNCASSQSANSESHYFSPLELQSESEAQIYWQALPLALEKMGIAIVKTENNNYLHATATSKLLKFVDDLEVHWIIEKNALEFRSQSRVGYSDLGANKKRLHKLVKILRDMVQENHSGG